jgi:hypothetical protein
MKKNIAKRLNELSDTLPVVFEWEVGMYQISGYELNLTPLSDMRKFDNDAVYEIPMPQMRAVTHKQQIKDAFKRGGVTEVEKYINSVA